MIPPHPPKTERPEKLPRGPCPQGRLASGFLVLFFFGEVVEQSRIKVVIGFFADFFKKICLLAACIRELARRKRGSFYWTILKFLEAGRTLIGCVVHSHPMCLLRFVAQNSKMGSLPNFLTPNLFAGPKRCLFCWCKCV